MSKTSYFLLALITAALIYMGAVRWQQWRAEKREKQEIASQNDGTPFTFQQVPISLAAPEVELMKTPVKYQRSYPEIYLEDAPLAPQQQAEQAQKTIVSIVEDFKNEPAVAQFNQDLQKASSGEVKDLVDLSTQNLQELLTKNPEIGQVVQKHSADVNFAKVLKEIFENPQFQQSVKELQEKGAATQKQPAQ